MSVFVGHTIANHRVEELIGSGSTGEVYRGVHLHRPRAVAIKILHASLAHSRGFQTRFLQEAKAAASLNHRNVVQIHDFGEYGGRSYLIMELALGGSLRALLLRHASAGQPLPWPTGVSLVWQAATGLQYAHTRGMVHRDIKPDNLLLQPRADDAPLDGTLRVPGGDTRDSYSVRIGDFGLAQLQHDPQSTTVGVSVGTPAYVSPEQCQGMPVDGRSDLYSLGIVLYEIATGYLPFETKSMVEALQKHVSEAPPPPRGLRADLPLDLEAVILRCLAKRPEDRYATAEALATALGDVLAAAPPAPPPAAPRAPAAPKQVDAYEAIDRAALSRGAQTTAPRLLVADRHGRVRSAGALSAAGLSVGRDPDNGLVLPDQRVSRHHLRIEWDGAQAAVTDLASGNGTWLDETRLPPNVRQTWPPGATVTVGPFHVRLDAAGETAPALLGGASALSSVAGGGVTSLDFPPPDDLAAAARQASHPRLVLLDRSGQQQKSLDLSEGEIIVGRSDDNHIALRERTVSRRHVRIEWNGRQATVTDLGSDNGTWLGAVRLSPDVPRPWPANESLRVGSYLLQLEFAAPAAPRDGKSTAVGRVQVLLDSPALTLTTGRPAILRGTVANLGNVVDHIWVEVEGVPTSWVAGQVLSKHENEMLQLNPGAQAPLVLTVTVPHVPDSHAGEYSVKVIARSRANPEEMGLAQATWTVLPFTSSNLALDRGRATGYRSAAFGVIARNDGNTTARLSIDAHDPERRLQFRLGQATPEVGPGRASNLSLRVRAPWHWFGPPRVRPFTVSLTPSAGEPPAPAPAEFVQTALVPQWLPRAAAAAIPLVLIAAILLQSWIVGLLRPRIVDFSAPGSVVAGEQVILSWSVERAQRIQLDGLEPPVDATPTPIAGTGRQVLDRGLEKDQQVKLVASNLFGPSERSRTIAVLTRTPTPPPTPTATTPPTPTPEIPVPVIELFRVEPAAILLGEQVTISWHVRDAQTVVIEGLSAGQLSASGQLTQRPERSTTYVITASNQGRPAEPRAQEVVVRTPTPSPTPSPTPTRPPSPTAPPS